MQISTNVVPPGGWYFQDGAITFNAPTYSKLVDMVTQHRMANNLPMGEPGKEIMDAVAKRAPHLRLHKPTIAQKAVQFAYALKRYVQGGGKLVDKAEADRRAAICAGCHNNVGTILGEQKGGCGTCAKAALAGFAQLHKMVLNGRAAAQEDKLNACSLCGCDLKLKVWFPKEYFDPDGSQSNKWPSFCWMK